MHMKKKKTLLLLLTCLLALPMLARQRSNDEIMTAAAGALKNTSVAQSRSLSGTQSLKILKRQKGLTVVGADEGGFALIANDDRFNAVVGYSDTRFGHGRNDAFDCYMTLMDSLLSQENTMLEADNIPSVPSWAKPYVEPLVTTTWNQTFPYNDKCPMFKEPDGSQSRSITGCVATALAQVMNYFKQPEYGYGINIFKMNHSDISTTLLSYDFGHTRFDWANMRDEYVTLAVANATSYLVADCSEEEREAVSNLMFACGMAVNMEYKSSASGANIIPGNLKHHFGYTTHNLLTTNAAYAPLSEGIPLLVDALSSNGARGSRHLLVADGYNRSGLLHLNWGWGGSADGYYTWPETKNSGYRITSFTVACPEGRWQPEETIVSQSDGTLDKFLSEIQKEDSDMKPCFRLKVRGTVDADMLSLLTKYSYQRTGYLYLDLSEAKLAGTSSKIEQSSALASLYYEDNSGFITVGSRPPYGNITVELPPSVTSIGSYGMTAIGIREVVLPNTVTTIEDHAFYDGGLSTIKIPNSVTSIGKNAFTHCGNLDAVELPSSITKMEDGLFASSSISKVIIPNSVTTIGKSVFANCKNLKYIELPASLKTIDGPIFNEGTYLAAIRITATTPPTVGTDLSEYFSVSDPSGSSYESTILYVPAGCKSKYRAAKVWKNFTNIVEDVPYQQPAVTEIEKEVDGITYLLNRKDRTAKVIKGMDTGKVSIPESVTVDWDKYTVTSLGTYAFDGFLNLTEVSLPEQMTSIGYGAFQGCKRLASIDIPASVTEIGGSAFRNCRNLESVSIPSTVTTIGDFAFATCPKLESISIPKSIAAVGYEAFRDCYNIKKVEIEDLGQWCNIDFKSDQSNPLYYARHLYMNGQEVTEVVIPDTVTQIGATAFIHCENLRSVTLPKALASIGESAFEECFGLSEVSLPKTLKAIRNNAFANCVNLSGVALPDSVTIIGLNAFAGCDLSSISIPASVSSVGGYAFGDCSNMTSITIECPVRVIDYNAFEGDIKIDHMTLNCDTIPQRSSSKECWFPYFKNVKTVILGDSVTCIEFGAFDGWKNLTSLTIGKSVKYFVASFNDCGNFVRVDISDLESWCDIDFQGNPLTRAHHLYLNGEEVKNLVIPSTVTAIRDYTFRGCWMNSLVIPSTVTSIGESAFELCTQLTDIYNLSPVPQKVKKSSFRTHTNQSGFITIAATLHVPLGSKVLYEVADVWEDFNIVEEDLTGIQAVGASEAGNAPWYDLNGRKLQGAPTQQGIYIHGGRKVWVR